MEHLGILIPILAISIPLVAVTGRVIVQPLVEAISRLAQAPGEARDDARLEQRFAQLEARLERMEKVANLLAEEYEFRRQLERPRPAPPAPASEAAEPDPWL